MKNHITKAIALVMVVMMLVGSVPSTVLPVFALSDSAQSNSIFDNVVLGKGTVTNTENYLAGELVDVQGNKIVDNTLSPYEPYSTMDESHPFLPGNEAWMDLSKIYYGAPATPNYPITKWSANTSVVNITGTGEKYGADAGVLAGKEIHAIDDMNLIDEYLWVNGTREIDGKSENGIAYNGSSQDGVSYSAEVGFYYDKTTGKYYNTNSGKDMGYTWNDANDNNSHDSGEIVDAKSNVIVFSWDREATDANGRDHFKTTFTYDAVSSKKENTTAYVYNRYDAMQGKWGLTLDKNVSSVAWTPTWAKNYYGTTDLNNSFLYLSDTPYLYYSTEALDSTQMAISLLIGVKTQNEKRTVNSGGDVGQTTVTVDANDRWEYRWYTITDNSDRPGIGADTLDNSMVPLVTKSDVVAEEVNQDILDSSSKILATIQAQNADGLDPLAIAAAAGKKTEEMYVSGAITGCIDFTQLLPTLMGVNVPGTTYDSGREDIMYKIVQVRVDTKTADGEVDSAARINYMYFGPGQAAVYTPQTTEGNDVNGANWMWAQNDHGFGDQNPNGVAKEDYHWFGNTTNFGGFDAGYTNGWENGQAVSITNTPNNPQLMTIDTYGQGGGKFITYDEYKAEMEQNGKTGHNAIFTKGSTDPEARIWRYTDANGTVQYLEAEYTAQDNNRYIMVTVPIRKWVNVLGDSRKLSFKMEVLQYGENAVDPAFCMWGNKDGSLGMGHSKISYGARFRNEDILAVFGEGYYHVDCSDTYVTVEVDKTIGNSLFYDGSDCWFDLLRSPYIYERTVTGASPRCHYGTEMIGYTFVTAIRFAVPAGAKFTMQEMKGDGNSAGLNSYSTSGDIVNAFDGGTGVQPEIIVDNALTENKMTITGANGNYTYTQTTNGTLNGTQSSGAAAYGPMLEQSFYTIYDMLDTEMINAAGKNSHFADNDGQDQLTVYGQMWTPYSAQLPIYHIPDVEKGIKYGYTYGPGAEFPIYATVKISGENNEKWGLTGVVTDKGTPEIGWILLWDAGDDDQTDIEGQSGRRDVKAQVTGGVLYDEYTATRAEASGYWYGRNIIASMKNTWTLSNFINDYSDFRDGTNTTFEHGIDFGGADNPYARDIYNANNSGVQFMFANMWRTPGSGGTNTGATLKDTTLRSVNNTDMEIAFTRKNNMDQNWSIGMTRVFDTPITLHTNTIHNSYPVFYYDYTATEGIANNNDSNMIALSLRVDGKDDYLYYLDLEGSTNRAPTKGLMTDALDGGDGSCYGYFSFEKLMTETFKGKTVEIVGISLYVWRAKSANLTSDKVTIRRMEIWQEETNYLDEILSTNKADMTAKIKDSMNIINDAYFHSHNENTDGGYTISRVNNADGTGAAYDRTNIGINESLGGYKFNVTEDSKFENATLEKGQSVGTAVNGTGPLVINRTVSYRKTNSNKGWSARISTDTNKDGLIDGADITYYSGDFDAEKQTGVDGIYEYRTALGHLRVWVPAGQQASVVFEADRSFNVDNYKYLYYSYSMRDVEAGISAEEKSQDGKGSGIAVAIKSQQNISDRAYLEDDGSWTYYPAGSSYWSDQAGRQDMREFNTTMNAALDLSTLDIDAVNQFVFYLNNTKEVVEGDPDANKAEFYINYIYLSNVPPTDLIKNELEQVQTQYYYMMDNTGDRYSARFPTIDNPTGQVTGTNADNDRVNPIKVVRGEYLSTGTYFNDDRLYGYGGDASTDRTFNEQTPSVGYYEKTYNWTGDPNAAENGSMKNILFYAGESEDLNDINDYYDYKERNNDGNADIYDMLWSYGRWYTGEGESGLNNMFIGKPGTAEDKQGANFREDSVSGALVRRYATENYVLLRSGITPKKYTTYFDANGGEFLYDHSPDEIVNLQKVSERSYYVTNNVILSYFEQPKNRDVMKGKVGEDDENTFLKKPGYKFSHWEHYNVYGERDDNFNVVNEESTSPDGNGARFMTFIKKTGATTDYFRAVWVPDTENYPADKRYTATFQHVDSPNVWKTVAVGDEVSNVDDNNGRFVLTIPHEMVLTDGTLKTRIYGWKLDGDTSGKVFNPGDKIYLLENATFVPVTNQSEGNTFNITLEGAKLYVKTDNGKLNPVEKHGAKIAVSGNVYNYSFVQENYALVAVPVAEKDDCGWMVVTDPNSQTTTNLVDSTVTLLSDNAKSYSFTAHEDISIVYSDVSEIKALDFYQAQDCTFATVSAGQDKSSLAQKSTVYFTSQFEIGDGCEVLAFGMLLSKDTYINKYRAMNGTEVNGEIITNYVDKMFRLNETKLDADSIEQKTYTSMTMDSGVRTLEATEASSNYEYRMRINHTSTTTDATYYARTYVIYKKGDAIKVAYSDIAAYSLASKVSA